MYQTYKLEVGGRDMIFEIGRVAELANGAVIVRYGDTTVLVTATASEKPREGIDFFPLSIDYEEKMYAAGKIPGGFTKREGRPSEHAILTSRVIDRPIRPLFPKDYRNDVCINAAVLSVDQENSPEICAMVGASLALSISDIPFQGPTGAVSVGYVDGEYVINPNREQRAKSRLNLTVASTTDRVMMIEAGANEITDEEMYDAIMFGHKENVKIAEFIKDLQEKIGNPKHSYEEHVVDHNLYEAIREFITDARMETAVFAELKQDRDEQISAITAETLEALKERFCGEDEAKYAADIDEAIYKFEKETVRRMILKDHKRPDGRKLDEIRPLSAEVDVIPRVHGSGLFKRGQTQVLTITTLGTIGEAQKIDGLDEDEVTKRYIHHYNFPSYSVGETRPSRSPGRREIGHGALAERALLPIIPGEEEFPYAIRLVSEVVSSNGSTSQGSVCGSTLSLMAAGVPIKAPVAGISCGLVTGETDDDFVLLTDIQGLEDFFGDMDFKVAGTHEGITAIQMDIKIHGLTPEIIKGALKRCHEARLYILDEVMLKAIPEVRDHISEYAPKIEFVQIDPSRIGEVVGSKGKTINRIIEESGVDKIDTEDDGKIYVSSKSSEAIGKAISMILAIVTDPEPGAFYEGKVTKIMNFGVFVEIAPDKEGLIRMKDLDYKFVEKAEDVVKEGDYVNVMVKEIDEQGRINLSRKACLPKPEGYRERPPRSSNGGDRRQSRPRQKRED
ncbi:MAG: polyribonucleotide nucleotidyltransferase [Clostridiales bacterium]|nr:polyribonucleotide nucleotidyltransferase [Clostridiales bacterium]